MPFLPALPRETPSPDAAARIGSPRFPGERLMVCLNPRLRGERRRKREKLLATTEETLEKITASVRAGTLKGKAETGHRVGREANRTMVEKHFGITTGEISMSRVRRHERIRAEARVDGIHVIRTSLEEIEPEAAVASCRRLSTLERAPDRQGQLNLPRSKDGQPLGVSPGGKRTADTERTSDGLVVHSPRALLDDLSGVVPNKVRHPDNRIPARRS